MPSLPRIAVIGTGGTISSLGASSLDVLDYPDFGEKLTSEALLDSFPVDTSTERPWMRTALFGTTKELEGLLAQGLDANSRTAAGTTALMMAAHDADKVRLLLARGADVSAMSDARHNALMVSAN